jgi:hypothetical protein
MAADWFLAGFLLAPLPGPEDREPPLQLSAPAADFAARPILPPQ